MNAQKMLLFCFLVSGQLLAMEADKSHALVPASHQSLMLAPADTSWQTFWWKITDRLVGIDDGEVRLYHLHRNVMVFLKRWGDVGAFKKLKLEDVQGLMHELEALKNNPYFGKENPALVRKIELRYLELCSLRANKWH